MKKAVYPGTFDPLSIGHLDIIHRASHLVDELHILVSTNPRKSPTFSVDERIGMIRKVTHTIPNLVIASSDDLVINYATQNHIDLIVRGLRTIQDYENEFSLYQFNRQLDKHVETVILFPSSKNLFVSSSAIKELVHYGADISPYVPKEIIADIVKKIPKRQ